MSTNTAEEARPQFMPMLNSDLAKVILLGAIVGIAVWGLSGLFASYVFEPILCQGEATRCAVGPQYGMITATVLSAIVALLGLVRFRIFRPMLVVLAATLSLWGLTELTQPLAWYWAALASTTLYALAYGVFVWAVRVRAFWLALVLVIALIMAVRAVLTS